MGKLIKWNDAADFAHGGNAPGKVSSHFKGDEDLFKLPDATEQNGGPYGKGGKGNAGQATGKPNPKAKSKVPARSL